MGLTNHDFLSGDMSGVRYPTYPSVESTENCMSPIQKEIASACTTQSHNVWCSSRNNETLNS